MIRFSSIAVHKKDLLACCFIFLLAGIVFSDFFTKGYTLNANHDVREQMFPAHMLELRAFQAHKIPQWNPYIHCGTVYMGGGQETWCYPFIAVAYLFPEQYLEWMITLLLILHVCAAGIFAYLFFKELIKEHFWALLASVIYLLSGASIINMTVSISCFSFLVYMPLLLYLIQTYDNRPFLRNCIYMTAAFALFFLVGMHQRILYTLWLTSLFALYRFFVPSSGRKGLNYGLIIAYGISIAGAVAIAAIRLVPFIVNSRQGITAAVTFTDALRYCYLPFQSILRLFAPEFFGMKLHETFLFSYIVVSRANHLETMSAYAGLAGIMITMCAVFCVWKRQFVFWKTVFIVMLLMLFTVPFKYLHYLGTMKSALLLGRMAWFIPLCVASLTGLFGALFWDDSRKKVQLRWVSAIASCVVMVTMGYLYNHYLNTPGVKIQTLLAMRFSIMYYICMSAILLGLFFVNGKILSRAFLLIFVAADMLFISQIDKNNSHPFLSPAGRYDNPLDYRVLANKVFNREDRMYRVAALMPTFYSNECIRYGFYISGGNDSFCSPYLVRLYSGLYDIDMDRSANSASYPKDDLACRLTSTFYLLNPELRIIMAGKEDFPRIRFYNKYEVVSSDSGAFEAVIRGSYKARQSIVLDRAPSISVTPGASPRAVDFYKDEPEHVEIGVTAPVNTLLFLADTYAVGWKAFVDEKETEIMRADYAFRAVALPAGTHKVAFKYEHPALKIASALSLTGISVFSILCITAFFARSPRTRAIPTA